jgi:hypothetical protein
MAEATPELIALFSQKFSGLFQGQLAVDFATDLAQAVVDLGYGPVAETTPAPAQSAPVTPDLIAEHLVFTNEVIDSEFEYVRHDDGTLTVNQYTFTGVPTVIAVSRVDITVTPQNLNN